MPWPRSSVLGLATVGEAGGATTLREQVAGEHEHQANDLTHDAGAISDYMALEREKRPPQREPSRAARAYASYRLFFPSCE